MKTVHENTNNSWSYFLPATVYGLVLPQILGGKDGAFEN